MTKKREVFKISKETWGDYTSHGPWRLKGKTYKFIEDFPSRDCVGKCHNVIVQRKSDNKFFKFTWFYDSDNNYYYDDTLEEVFPKTITTTKYE
jgi:hypothetical protein